MRKFFVVLLCSLFLLFQSSGQALKLSEVERFLKFSVDEMDTYVATKGFTYVSIEEIGDYSVCKYQKGTRESKEYIIKYVYKSGGVICSYSFFDVVKYSEIKKQLQPQDSNS